MIGDEAVTAAGEDAIQACPHGDHPTDHLRMHRVGVAAEADIVARPSRRVVTVVPVTEATCGNAAIAARPATSASVGTIRVIAWVCRLA